MSDVSPHSTPHDRVGDLARAEEDVRLFSPASLYRGSDWTGSHTASMQSDEPSYYAVPSAHLAPHALVQTSIAKPTPRGGWIAAGAGLLVVAFIILTALIVTSIGRSDRGPASGPIPNRIDLAVTTCDLVGSAGVEIGDEGSSVTIDTAGTQDFSGLGYGDLLCMLTGLDIPDSIQSQILATRALDGVQSAAYDEVSLTWSYDSDGLTLIVSLAD